MNVETLETLLIDRALGHLSPEVEVLLAEHLAANPTAARSAAELRETVALASSVLKSSAPRLVLPPPAMVMFPQHRTRRVMALAASFVAGAGITLFALRGTGPQPAPVIARTSVPAAVVAQAPSPRRVEVDPAVRTLPFWSKERAVALAVAKQSNR